MSVLVDIGMGKNGFWLLKSKFSEVVTLLLWKVIKRKRVQELILDPLHIEVLWLWP